MEAPPSQPRVAWTGEGSPSAARVRPAKARLSRDFSAKRLPPSARSGGLALPAPTGAVTPKSSNQFRHDVSPSAADGDAVSTLFSPVLHSPPKDQATPPSRASSSTLTPASRPPSALRRVTNAPSAAPQRRPVPALRSPMAQGALASGLSPSRRALAGRLASGQARGPAAGVHADHDVGSGAVVATTRRTLGGRAATVAVRHTPDRDLFEARAVVDGTPHVVTLCGGAIVAGANDAVFALAAFEAACTGPGAGSVASRWSTAAPTPTPASVGKLLSLMVELVDTSPSSPPQLMYHPPVVVAARRTVRVSGGSVRASCCVVAATRPRLWLPRVTPAAYLAEPTAHVVVVRLTRPYDGRVGTLLLGPGDVAAHGLLGTGLSWMRAQGALTATVASGLPPSDLLAAVVAAGVVHGVSGGDFRVALPAAAPGSVEFGSLCAPSPSPPAATATVRAPADAPAAASDMLLDMLDIAHDADDASSAAKPSARSDSTRSGVAVVEGADPAEVDGLPPTPLSTVTRRPSGHTASHATPRSAWTASSNGWGVTPASTIAKSPGAAAGGGGVPKPLPAPTRQPLPASAGRANRLQPLSVPLAVDTGTHDNAGAGTGVASTSAADASTTVVPVYQPGSSLPPPPPSLPPPDDLPRWCADALRWLGLKKARKHRKADARYHALASAGLLSRGSAPEAKDDACRWSRDVCALAAKTLGKTHPRDDCDACQLLARWQALCRAGSIPGALHMRL